jgi:hypothetical protein
MPGETGVTVVTTLVCFFIFRTRGCGREPSARHSLRPLIFRRRNDRLQNSGMRRENVDARHCEERKRRSNPDFGRGKVWIASLRLAMTAV